MCETSANRLTEILNNHIVQIVGNNYLTLLCLGQEALLGVLHTSIKKQNKTIDKLEEDQRNATMIIKGLETDLQGMIPRPR